MYQNQQHHKTHYHIKYSQRVFDNRKDWRVKKNQYRQEFSKVGGTRSLKTLYIDKRTNQKRKGNRKLYIHIQVKLSGECLNLRKEVFESRD